MKKKTGFSKKRIIQILIILTIVGIGGAYYARNAMAIFNENRAMRFSQYSATHTIENSTLFVGTYLINLAGNTDALYQKALDSASESGQNNKYYKSELAGGAWFDVSDAEKLTDISDTGQQISTAELADLFVQYYVGADGVVIDVMTGDAINPFNVPDPYKLSRLPELEPLWIQYAGSSEEDSISLDDFLKARNSEQAGTLRTDVYKYQILSTFFNLDLRDSDTDKLDADLARLFASYQALKSAGNNDEAELTYRLMGKVDSARRAIVMEKLSQGEKSALGIMMELTSGGNYTVSKNFLDASSPGKDSSNMEDWQRSLMNAVSHDFESNSNGSGSDWWGKLPEGGSDVPENKGTNTVFTADSALTDATGTSMQNCATSYNTDKANALVDTDTILGHADYEYSTRVIEEASADGLGGPINYLRDVVNIEDNIIKNKDSELSMLNSSLLSLGDAKFEGAVSAGISDEYKSMISTGEGASAADSVLNEQGDKAENARGELEYLIEAYKQRSAPADALAYVNDAITRTEGLRAGVKADEFSSRANGTLDKHIKWLSDLAEEIKNSDESLRSKLDELKGRKADAQRKRDAALDDNDLAGARDLDAQIAAIDQDIADEEGKNGGDDDDLSDDLAKKTLAKLADDPNADISGALNALAGLGNTDALDALADRAADAGASQAAQNAIKDAQDKADKNAGKNGNGKDGSGKDGSGAGGSGINMNRDELLAALENFFGGKSPSEMAMDELAVSTAALSRFSRMGCKAATELAGELTEIGRTTGNIYFYTQYNGGAVPEYISLKTIADCTSYRYFYDDTKKIATLTQSSKVFTFHTGNSDVERSGSAATLFYKTEYLGVPYISKKDSDSLFGCSTEYVPENTYAVCLTKKMQSKVEELLEAFQQ